MRKENSIVRQTNKPTEKKKRYNSKLLSNYMSFSPNPFPHHAILLYNVYEKYRE